MAAEPKTLFRYIAASLLIFGISTDVSSADLPLENIKLPAGFRIELFVSGLPGARSMAHGPNGLLFVGTRDNGDGKVYAVQTKEGTAPKIYVIASGLNQPNGVAYKDGSLFVAEIGRILRFDNIRMQLDNPPKPVAVYDKFPTDEHHGWKFIRFGPDGKLYIPVGAPCNVCEKPDPYSSITRMAIDGTGFEVVARGVRNSVGFDWDPRTGALWFTDNGRDLMGDNVPSDELNKASGGDSHFGFPYCHAGDISDPTFGRNHPCSDYKAPEQKLGPHVAALGMRFYTGKMFPESYRNQIFIAEHGSWNRSTKLGYRIMLVRLKDGKAVSYEPFAEGWLKGGKVWGRPVDVEVWADGSLLVSDDHAGAIYRISY